MAWFDTSPERLLAEVAAFTDLGWPCDIDEAARQVGRLVVRTRATFGDTEYALEVQYPSGYPFFPPIVVNLGPPTGTRHEHPREHTLCLLHDHGRQWKPYSDRAAALIHDKFPQILRINADPLGELAASEESRQAEPFSAYLPYQQGSHIAMPPLDGTPVAQGTASLKLFGYEPYRGFLASLTINGRTVDFDLPTIMKSVVDIEVPIVALAQAPRTWAPEELWDLACSELGRPPNWTSVKNDDARWPKKIRALALIYPDELQWRRVGPNLTLLIERRNAKSVNGKYTQLAAVRTEFESATFRQARVPELREFPQRKVALFGTGALGSFVAMELARSGIGQLSVLDCDDLSAGNTVRWALGRNYAGYPKAGVIAHEIRQAYPHTQVQPVGLRLGAHNLPGEEAKLLEMLAGADIVVDATASLRVNDYLSRLAHDRNVPYIWLSTTNGAWGGMVGRVRPGAHACWMCHRHHMTEGGAIEPPVEKPGELDVQPAGCLDPTFTGTAFDANEVVLQAVRLVASTLCSGAEGGYPGYTWDIATVALRTQQGHPIVPQWTTYRLDPHPDCCGESVA